VIEYYLFFDLAFAFFFFFLALVFVLQPHVLHIFLSSQNIRHSSLVPKAQVARDSGKTV